MWGLWKIRPILQSSGDNGPDRDKAKGWQLLVQHKRSWQVDHWLIPVRSTEVEISKQEARNPERQAPESDSVARILQHTSSQSTKGSSFATWIHGYKSETVPLCPPPHAHTSTHTKRLESIRMFEHRMQTECMSLMSCGPVPLSSDLRLEVRISPSKQVGSCERIKWRIGDLRRALKCGIWKQSASLYFYLLTARQ